MVDVLVAGRSLPALQTALDFAEVGLSVVVAGGAAEPELAEPVRDPDGVVAEFLTRVAQPIDGAGGQHPAAAPRVLPPASPLLRDASGKWLRQPEPNVLGVPAVALSSESIKLLGTGRALRAYLDRVTPLLTVGKTRFFGELVRKRMGGAVRDTLVTPQVFERYGVTADEVEAAIAAPGLNETLSRAGALGAAVLAYSERNVARETRVEPEQGWPVFQQELLRRLEHYGVGFVDSAVSRLAIVDGSLQGALEDGSVIEARAVVIDHGRDPMATSPLSDRLSALAPGAARTYSEIDIQRPPWLPVPDRAVAVVDGWVVTLEALDGDTARVRCVSAVAAVAPIETSEPTESSAAPVLGAGEILTQLGVEVRAGQTWRTGATAAPFATVDARDQARARLAETLEARPEILPVGMSLHGDDLGAALEHSHRSAVTLRRRLLGLER